MVTPEVAQRSPESILFTYVLQSTCICNFVIIICIICDVFVVLNTTTLLLLLLLLSCNPFVYLKIIVGVVVIIAKV